MIDNLRLLNQFNEQMNASDLTSVQRKIVLSKYIQMFLDQLQLGDTVEGVVTKGADGKFILQISPQLNIPVQMSEQLETGKLMTFMVQGKENGKLYLQPALSVPEQGVPLIQKTMIELNLPKNGLMQEFVEGFVQKHLPLVKDTLLKAYEIGKEHLIPSKIITNLIDNNQIFSPEEASATKQLRTDGLKDIITQLKSMTQNLTNHQDLIKVAQVFQSQISPDKLENMMKSAVSEILAHPINDKGYASAEFLGVKEEPWLKVFKSIMDLNIPKDQENVLKKFIGSIYDEAMMVKIENMRLNETESQKIYTTYELLEKLATTLDKAHLSQEDREYLNFIKEPVNVLGKLNIQAEYFIFPMLNREQQTQGEIYFFKPKKTTAKNQNNLYVVLALNFPSINDIEIHIHKQDKKIRMTINVTQEEIQKHISQYMPRLYEQIKNLGFQFSQIEWGLINQNKEKVMNSKSDADHLFNHMDLKV